MNELLLLVGTLVRQRLRPLVLEVTATTHALSVPGGEEGSGTNPSKALQAATDGTRGGVIFHPQAAAKTVVIKLSNVAVVVVSEWNPEGVNSVRVASIPKYVVVRAPGKPNSARVLAPV